MRSTLNRSLLRSTIRRFQSNNDKRSVDVVEIGCIRSLSESNKKGDGHSTKQWAEAGFNVIAVDNNNRAVQVCRDYLKDFSNVRVILSDGVTFIANMEHDADIFFLDAMGPTASGYQEFHFKLFESASKHLKQGGVIIVDDVDLSNGEKAGIILKRAPAMGFKATIQGSMALFEKE